MSLSRNAMGWSVIVAFPGHTHLRFQLGGLKPFVVCGWAYPSSTVIFFSSDCVFKNLMDPRMQAKQFVYQQQQGLIINLE